MKQFSIPKQNVYSFLTGLAILLLLVPSQSFAQHGGIFSGHDDLDADITSRLVHKDAEYAMTTRAGSVEMLLSDDTILLQFSDQFLDDLEEEIRDDEEHYEYEEASVLADVFKSMITSGVRKLLDHALAIPLREIKEIYYQDGRIYIIDHAGDEIFGDLEIDDVDVMEDFSRRDARRFVAAVERRMI